MATPEIERMLAEYAFGSLSEAERNQLFRAAYDDPDLFEQLAEQERLRVVLNDEEFQRKLQRTLKGRFQVSLFDQITSWMRSPVGMGAVALTAAAALTLVILRPPAGQPQTAIQLAAGPSESQLQALDLSAAKGLSFAQLDLDRTGNPPRYRLKDKIRISFQSDKPAQALLVEIRPGERTLRLFPNVFTSSARIEAGQAVLVPPAGQGELLVDGAPGRRRLRLLLFPVDVDPLSPGLDFAALSSRIETVEREFEVEP